MSFELDDTLGVLIANIRNSIKNNLEKKLSEYDITPAQSIVIRRLCEKDNLTQKELAKDTFFKQSSLTLIIDKLENKGIVKREAKENDRRAYLICITKKGKDLQQILKDAQKDVEKVALKNISDNKQHELIETLKIIYSNVK